VSFSLFLKRHATSASRSSFPGVMILSDLSFEQRLDDQFILARDETKDQPD
jgi:hypothetical protein